MVPTILETLGPRPLGWGVADPCKYHPPPSVLPYHSLFDRSASNGTSVMTEICRETLTPRVPPFNGTQDHQNRYGKRIDRLPMTSCY